MAASLLDLTTFLPAGRCWQGARGLITPCVMQVNNLFVARSIAPTEAGCSPSDPQISFHLARYIEQVRTVPENPIVVRQKWLHAYAFFTVKLSACISNKPAWRLPAFVMQKP